MAVRSFLCAFALAVLSCSICSPAVSAATPSVSAIAWLPKHRQFCNVSLTAGTVSNCFSLPNVYLMGVSGAVHANQIYITGQNLSTSLWYTMSINMDKQNVQWATSINPNNYFPIMTTYSIALGEAVVVSGSNGYTWLVNSTKAVQWMSYGYGQQGTYDQSLQEFWSVTTNTIYQLYILKQSSGTVPNTYNIVLLSVSSTRQALYCIAQAADGSLLYVYDTYLSTWSFIGCISNMVPVPNTASILDPTESYLSFVASVGGKISLVTISVTDASVVASIASPDASIILLESY